LVAGVTNISHTTTQTTFNFVGSFRDVNINQVFRVTYRLPNDSIDRNYNFDFKRIKSLFHSTATCARIQPNQLSVSAPSCQITNIAISFPNVQYGNPFESPQLCYGTITTYEYLLPAGWQLNGFTSNGSNWIAGDNSETVTTNLLGGNNGQILVRPTNSCNTSLSKNQPPVAISITRPNTPVLKINNSTSLTLYCGDAGAKTFTVENAGTCITGYEWLVANKGWYDASGNLITANIITTTPSITIYPSCTTSNPPQAVQVKIKAGSEEISSTVGVTFSSAAPPLAISGPDEFCTSASYSVPISPACGASVTWSLEYLNNHPNVATLSCTNCQTTTLTKYNNGTALLRATVSFPNCNSTGIYEKYIGVGSPVIRGWYNSPTNSSEPLNPSSRFQFNWNDACYTQYINTNMDITANATVLWEDAGNSGGVTWTQVGNNLRFYFSDLDQYAYFRVTATNSCGSQSVLYRFRSVSENCSGGTPLRVMASPNPATSNLTVSLVAKGDNKKIKEIMEIRIIDKLGTIKQKWTYSKSAGNQPKQLDISKLSQDIYTIMVFDGTVWTTEKFIKQ